MHVRDKYILFFTGGKLCKFTNLNFNPKKPNWRNVILITLIEEILVDMKLSSRNFNGIAFATFCLRSFPQFEKEYKGFCYA